MFEDVAIGARRDGQFVIVIAEKKGAGLEMHLQLAALQDAAVLIAQDREQDLVLEIRLERMPLDIEIRARKGNWGRFRARPSTID